MPSMQNLNEIFLVSPFMPNIFWQPPFKAIFFGMTPLIPLTPTHTHKKWTVSNSRELKKRDDIGNEDVAKIKK